MAEEQGLTGATGFVRHESRAHDVDVLGRILSAMRDSEARFDQAARDSEGDARRRLFESLADERDRVVRDLQSTLAAMGGSGDGGSILSKARRAVNDIGHALLGEEGRARDADDDVERALILCLEEALGDPELSDMARAAVRRARAAVGEDREDLQALKPGQGRDPDPASRLFLA